MKCSCNHNTCPKCDPGIKAFYQQKVEEAKRAAQAHFEATGIEIHYEDLLDAKDIWYEYCELRDQEELESLSVHPENIENPNSWK